MMKYAASDISSNRKQDNFRKLVINLEQRVQSPSWMILNN
jgi:hypothetical protein